MTLDGLNSLISVGIGINVIYALFDDVREKISSTVDGSLKEVRQAIEDAINEYIDIAAPNLQKQLIRANNLNAEFENKSELCTDYAKKGSFFATSALFMQLFVASTYPFFLSNSWYRGLAWLDLVIMLTPLAYCLLGNKYLSYAYNKKLRDIERDVIGFRNIAQPDIPTITSTQEKDLQKRIEELMR